jgi:diguanylate cyclase (GGDEF)-like protein
LFRFNVFLGVVYTTPVIGIFATGESLFDVRGEIIAAVISVVGAVAVIPLHPSGIRHSIALACAAVAPAVTMMFHYALEAQVWSLIPAMFLAMYIRAVYRLWMARAVCAVVAAISVTGLILAPAQAPALWVFLYIACIIGTAEIFGALGAALIDGALRDPLTSVWNRAGLAHAVTDLIVQARRRGEQLAVIVLDVDHFKSVNDRDGHAAGDRILIELTRAWAAQLPPTSVIARTGGDEFAVVLRGYDNTDARALASALTEGHGVTVTDGIAVGSARADIFGTLFIEADADLYRRKVDRDNAN